VNPKTVILMNAIYEQEIANSLSEMGLKPDLLTLDALPK
jgi:hypothetical protein